MGKKILGKKLKVAIYSGAIPSTIFIENLIESIATDNTFVYLFGKAKVNINYPNKKIRLFIIPTKRIKLFLFVFFQMFRLIITSPRDFIKLVMHYLSISKTISIHFFQWWGKVLPVVNNLPNIFHIQWAKSLSDWFFLKEIFGVKIILSLRGAHINYSPLADDKLAQSYKYYFPQIDYFHAVSESIALEACNYGISKNNIRIIYSSVDTKYLQKFKKTELQTYSPFQFISVGRYHWKKGYHYALSAIHALLIKGMNVHYSIIASGEPTEEILYQIHDLSLNDNVELISPLNQIEVYKKMSSSDCLILPSVEEGIANVVLEAMAIGILVISSDCGGMKEVVRNKENGYLFQNRNSKHLAKIMEDVISLDLEKRRSIINNAVEDIEKNHNLFKLGSEMKTLYNSIHD